jgi:hypothetical protein
MSCSGAVMVTPAIEEMFHRIRIFIGKSGHLSDVKAMKHINKLLNKLKHKNPWLHRDERHVNALIVLVQSTFEKKFEREGEKMREDYAGFLKVLNTFRQFIHTEAIKMIEDKDYSIYLLTWNDDTFGPNYDVAYGFVVVAKTQKEARDLCAGDAGDEQTGNERHVNALIVLVQSTFEKKLNEKVKRCEKTMRDSGPHVNTMS